MVKLRWLKSGIKKFVLEKRKINNLKRNQLQIQVEELETMDEMRHLTEFECEIRLVCKKEIMELDKEKIVDLRQRARVRWTIEGDENSRFFHGMIISNLCSDRLHGITIEGNWCQGPSLIKMEIHMFFNQKFKEPHDLRPTFQCPEITKMSLEESTLLIEPFSASKIKRAFWDCDNNKVPGPDGFNIAFIKRFWHILEKDFCDIFELLYMGEPISGVCSPHL
jgi:hypothetical protein